MNKARFLKQQKYLFFVEARGLNFHQIELGQIGVQTSVSTDELNYQEVTDKLDCWIFFLLNLNLPFYSQLIFLLPLPMFFSFTFGPCKGFNLSFGEFSLLIER